MTFKTLVFAPGVQARALRTSLLVGSVLAGINHGEYILAGTLDSGAIVKILLTYTVPYCVALYASVSAIKAMSAASTATNKSDK